MPGSKALALNDLCRLDTQSSVVSKLLSARIKSLRSTTFFRWAAILDRWTKGDRTTTDRRQEQEK
jgi:hypothetical protein